MKGSPMYRNYGIGASPVKQTKVNPKTGKVEIDLTTKPAGTGTVLKPKKENKKSNDPYAKAKKKDPNLNKYITERKKHKPGSDAYEAAQAKINAAYGKTRSSKVKASQIKTESKKATTTTPPPPPKEDTTPKTKTKVTTPEKAKATDPLSRLGDRITRKERMVKTAMEGGATKKEAKKMYKTVVKETKQAKKIDKIAATADVKTARAKYGRGSAEVKAAKAKRKKIKKTRIEDYKS